MYFLEPVETINFWKPEKRNNIFILIKKNQFVRLFCVTPPFKCRLSAKSIFLVNDINSIYKYTPKVRDKHWLLIQEQIKMGNRGIVCFLGKFANWYFKGNNLDVTMMHRNQYINLCLKSVSWEKYPYVVSKCALKSWKAPQLAPAPVFRKGKIQSSAKSCKFLAKYWFQKITNLSLFYSRHLKWILQTSYFQYLSR